MDAELLYAEDCPNWRLTAEPLEELPAELAFIWSAVVVNAPEAAPAVRFYGWPSVRINGVDPFADVDAPVGLTCRIDRTPTGPARSPDGSRLRAARIAAAGPVG
jgi:hypothetical protein